ncbi:hypothetical protein PENANT_c007G05644 [Penicillium antarcticum]|uniref:Uncharacterized protein n=1 Tax=Penicillium antarcticum TaxID=416450 RepID=A0A1V6QC33_9EURO|nr:hypothetical protein PENANT_c007G05644 [Penicillium antarcticum]
MFDSKIGLIIAQRSSTEQPKDHLLASISFNGEFKYLQ